MTTTVFTLHQGEDPISTLWTQRMSNAVGEDGEAYARSTECRADDLLLRRRHDQSTFDDARSQRCRQVRCSGSLDQRERAGDGRG